MTDLPTREAIADTEARHAHRDLLAEKDAEIERLTALLEYAAETLEWYRSQVAWHKVNGPEAPEARSRLQADVGRKARIAISRIKEPRNA